MQLHEIKPKTKNKTKIRVGRGGKRGTYSGKGMKGQKSRAGNSMRPELRDLIKKIPKMRGYRFNSIQEKPAIVNLSVLEKTFKDGDNITPRVLADQKVIRRTGKSMPVVKILGTGDIKKTIQVSGCQVSASAKEKIEKAGGSVK